MRDKIITMRKRRKIYLTRGESLVSLMIVVAITSALILLLIDFMSYMNYARNMQVAKLVLQEQVESILMLMRKDIQRSGYIQLDRSLQQAKHNFSLFLTDNQLVTITHKRTAVANSCLLFSYDLNQDGCLGERTLTQCKEGEINATQNLQKELFGYRLNQQMIESRTMYKSAVNDNCQGLECKTYLSKDGCDTRGWTDLMDAVKYRVTRLTFHHLSPQLIQVDIRVEDKKFINVSYQSQAIIALYNAG